MPRHACGEAQFQDSDSFIYLFLAMLRLHCCAAFSRCSEQGLPSSCSAQASHCIGASRLWSTGSRVHKASVVVAQRLLVAPWHVESSWTRDQTCIPHIGRQILNHWTTREVPRTVILRHKNTKLKPQGCEINSMDLPANRKDQNVLCKGTKFLFHVYTHIYAFTYVYLLGCDGKFIFNS